MRILYSVHGYKPAWRVGGPIISVSSAAEALVRKGHEVTVFTTNSNLDTDLDVPTDQPVDVNGVEVWYFRREEPIQKFLPALKYLSQSIGFLYCPEMKRELARVVPRMDLVHTHMPFVYPTFAAARAAREAGKPLFYHQRGNLDPDRLEFRGLKKKLYIALVERRIMEQAAMLIALTEAEKSSYRTLGISTPSEIVPNGVDLPEPRPGAAGRILERHRIPTSARVVLFLGRLHPVKGAEKLLEAFSRIVTDVPDAYLIMAGPDEWKLEETWKAEVAGRGLGERVIFPGMISGEEKADVLDRADLFSLPSIGEGFSMAVLEALAASTAVMLSPGCRFPEVVPASAGVIVPGEVNAMSAEMIRLLRDPDGLRKMGKAGRELVESKYSWEVITERLLEAYSRGIDRFNRMAG